MDDEAIISLYFARDEEAIRSTDGRYGRRLFRIADNILHDQQDAEECVNDTYLRAWNAIPPTRPDSLFAFLARISRNLALNMLDKANTAKRKAELVSLTQEMEQCIPDSGRGGETDARELGRLINAFLATLSRENQMVFVRRYWYAESTAQIAARYGIRENTLTTRLCRLRGKLKDYLQKEGIAL